MFYYCQSNGVQMISKSLLSFPICSSNSVPNYFEIWVIVQFALYTLNIYIYIPYSFLSDLQQLFYSFKIQVPPCVVLFVKSGDTLLLECAVSAKN